MALMAQPASEADWTSHGDRRGIKKCEATHTAGSASEVLSLGDRRNYFLLVLQGLQTKHQPMCGLTRYSAGGRW